MAEVTLSERFNLQPFTRQKQAVFTKIRMAVFSKPVAEALLSKVEVLLRREARLGYVIDPPTPVKGRSSRTHRSDQSSTLTTDRSRSKGTETSRTKERTARTGRPAVVVDSQHSDNFETPSLAAIPSSSSAVGNVRPVSPDSPGLSEAQGFQGGQLFRATWDARVREAFDGVAIKKHTFGSIWASPGGESLSSMKKSLAETKADEDEDIEAERFSGKLSSAASDPLRYLYSASLTPITSAGESFLRQADAVGNNATDALDEALKQRRRASSTLRPEALTAAGAAAPTTPREKEEQLTVADLRHRLQGFGLSRQKPLLSNLAATAEATMRLSAVGAPIGALKVNVSRDQSRQFIVNDRRRAREEARLKQEQARFGRTTPAAAPAVPASPVQKQGGKAKRPKEDKRDMLDRLLNPRPFPLPPELQSLIKLESPRREEPPPTHRSLEPVKSTLPQRASWEPALPAASANGKLEYLLRCQDENDIPSIKALAQLDRPYLRLNHYTLGLSGALAVADALRYNTKVNTLSMIGNIFGPPGGLALAKAFQFNKTLTSIDLSENDLGPEAVNAVFDALQHSPVIQALTLQVSKLYGCGMQHGCHNSSFVQNVGLFSTCAPHIKAFLAKTQTLNILDLSFNRLGDEG